MLELFRLAGKIDLQGMDEAEKGLDTVDQKAGGLGSKFGGAAKKVGKAGAVIGGAAAAAGTAAFAMTNKVTQGFDDIAKGAERLGVSTDAYQEMEYWASQNGISHQQMEKTIGRFNQRMGQAQNGNEKYSDALKQLGVDMEGVRNGTVSTDDAFAQSIQTLSEMESEQDKVNLATEMFGTKTARDLLPALNEGSLSMEDAREKAQELGIVIGEDTLFAAETFQDTWDNLKRSFSTFGQQIIAQLMPAFQAMMDWVLENMPTIQAVFQTVFDVIGTIFNAFKTTIQTVIELLQQWFASNEETMTGIWTTIQEVFTQVVEFLRESWEQIKTFFQENGQAILEFAQEIFQSYKETVAEIFNTVWNIISEVFIAIYEIVQEYLTLVMEFWRQNGEQLMESAKEIFNTIKDTVMTVFETIYEIISGILSELVPFIQEQLARIQAFWNENGEKIMTIVETAFSFIQGVIETVMPIIQSVIETAWEIIKGVFDAAIGIIMGLVETFASLLTGDFEGIKDGLTRIWESLWDGIESIVAGAWDLLSGAFSSLWDSISGWFGDLKDQAVDWGKNFISGFVDGIGQMGTEVAKAAENVVKEAGEFLKFWSPAKKGEGRYIRHWGRNMIDGFLDGVRDEEGEAGRAMENVVKRMNPGSLDFNANATVGGRGITGNGATSTATISQGGLETGNIESLLNQLIQAVYTNKDVFIDGQKVTGAVNNENAIDDRTRYF